MTARIAAAVATLVACAALGAPALAQTASPAPSASPKPSPAPTERLAIVSCGRAAFYVWPSRSSAPSPATYPPARQGDAIHVIPGDTLAPNGANLTETTIDTVEPWGTGKHYWIATACLT